MAITFVGSGGWVTKAARYGSLVVPLPGGIAAGDLLVLFQLIGDVQTPTTPSGWTYRGQAYLNSGYCVNVRVRAYTKVAAGGDADPTIQATNGPCIFGDFRKLEGHAVAFRGASAVEVVTAYTDATLDRHGGMTTLTDGSMVVMCGHQTRYHASGLHSGSAPGLASFTMAGSPGTWSYGNDSAMGSVWYGIDTVAGATGAMTYSSGISGPNAAIALALAGAGDIDLTVATRLGAEVGMTTPTLVVPADRMGYPPRGGVEVGMPGPRLTASAKRQVMLTGEDIETPQMTEGGDEGDVLTQHQGRPPTWAPPSAPSSTTRWVPLMDGHGNVLTDSGSGAAIMAQLAQE